MGVMRSTTGAGERALALPLRRDAVLRWLGLGAIVLLAALLRFSYMHELGNVNHYYTAAITSMIQSWYNFFYVVAEPGGALTVDKPPVGLWMQAISAKIFGVNTFGVLLPGILCGLGSVVLLYHLVRRSFGTAAGMVAALGLALAPVVVATDRNNTIDSILIFTLLCATWAFFKATERARLRFLLLGAALVGVGFNIKMLQAYMVLPALYAMYLLGARLGFWRKVLHLALATVVLLAVSLAWVLAVDMTPASQRPFIGSSTNNTVMELIVGHNGLDRLYGMGGMGGGRGGGPSQGGRQGGQGGQMQGQPGQGNAPSGQGGQGGQGRDGGQGRGGFGGFGGQGGQPQGGGFGGGGPGGDTGQAGPLRLFTTPLSKDAGWLLPMSLMGVILLAFSSRPRWPVAPAHQSLLAWGGWLGAAGVFFSIAGFFHEYYLSMLAVPAAALAGIAVVAIWHLRERHPWVALGAALAALAATMWLQYAAAVRYVGAPWWLWLAIGLAGAASFLLALGTALRRAAWGRWAALAGMTAAAAAVLLVPGVWSYLTMRNPVENASLPASYSGETRAKDGAADLTVDQELLDYLQANTQDTRYLLAVPSSMQGSDYVIATGRPVLYIGGFMGTDQVVNGDGLKKLVDAGELRYIYWQTSGGMGRGGSSDVSSYLTSACRVVQGFEANTQNTGAPGGTSRSGGQSGGGMGRMQIALYDCGAAASS